MGAASWVMMVVRVGVVSYQHTEVPPCFPLRSSATVGVGVMAVVVVGVMVPPHWRWGNLSAEVLVTNTFARRLEERGGKSRSGVVEGAVSGAVRTR